MTNPPMTTFGGDGKAPKRYDATLEPMSENTNVEDVEQSETTTFEEKIEEYSQWLDAKVEELDDLPTEDEAELGELCRTDKGQFNNCQLVDDETPALIEAIDTEV